MIPKFRAWDKVNERIVEVSEINFWTKVIDTTDTFLAFSNVELLQSTGLFDKNGKEIYEGHIVKFKDPYDKRFNAVGVVVLREDKACFGIDMTGTTEQFELYRITAENYLTVIGNKFEEGYLLEED
ncbi:YopX family protein [Mammaliicoccus sciuri]|uniref:YopX family protein n=1 Tax=Mammaliicoccus sciuri TaxID=1296 RepID=UPI0034DD921A